MGSICRPLVLHRYKIVLACAPLFLSSLLLFFVTPSAVEFSLRFVVFSRSGHGVVDRRSRVFLSAILSSQPVPPPHRPPSPGPFCRPCWSFRDKLDDARGPAFSVSSRKTRARPASVEFSKRSSTFLLPWDCIVVHGLQARQSPSIPATGKASRHILPLLSCVCVFLPPPRRGNSTTHYDTPNLFCPGGLDVVESSGPSRVPEAVSTYLLRPRPDPRSRPGTCCSSLLDSPVLRQTSCACRCNES